MEVQKLFYFLVAPFLVYNWVLIFAAVLPAVILLVRVYKLDRLESESPAMLWSMIVGGILSALLAIVFEWIGGGILDVFVAPEDPLYNVILYFVVVGFAEEGSKYIMLKKRSWRSVEFNCQYDGVVYSVFVSLGFAIWENISYVMHYGFSTALVRAVTAIPGHACFGVFMGVFYGLARGYAYLGEEGKSKKCRILCVLIPALIHGIYDYVASSQTEWGGLMFLVFIIVLFLVSFKLVKKMASNDRYYNMDRTGYAFWEQ